MLHHALRAAVALAPLALLTLAGCLFDPAPQQIAVRRAG